MRAATLWMAIVGMLLGSLAVAETLSVWPVDPHVKVFRDTTPPEKPGSVVMQAARNECEPAQIALRSAKPLAGVRVELSPLRHAVGRSVIDGDRLAWNFVGFIPLKKNTRASEAIQIRAAPCEVPDPLLDDRAKDLPAASTQPVWITAHVPRDAAPGVYRGHRDHRLLGGLGGLGAAVEPFRALAPGL